LRRAEQGCIKLTFMKIFGKDFGKRQITNARQNRVVNPTGKIDELLNIAPNGCRIDVIYLTEIMNLDESGTEWVIEYKEMDPKSIFQKQMILFFLNSKSILQILFKVGLN
jgi:hypothetical protein